MSERLNNELSYKNKMDTEDYLTLGRQLRNHHDPLDLVCGALLVNDPWYGTKVLVDQYLQAVKGVGFEKNDQVTLKPEYVSVCRDGNHSSWVGFEQMLSKETGVVKEIVWNYSTHIWNIKVTYSNSYEYHGSQVYRNGDVSFYFDPKWLTKIEG